MPIATPTTSREGSGAAGWYIDADKYETRLPVSQRYHCALPRRHPESTNPSLWVRKASMPRTPARDCLVKHSVRTGLTHIKTISVTSCRCAVIHELATARPPGKRCWEANTVHSRAAKDTFHGGGIAAAVGLHGQPRLLVHHTMI